MIVTEMIKQLQNLKPELKDKEIVVVSPNGLQLEPCIRFEPYSHYDSIGKGIIKKTVKKVVLTWE